jgi:hypothetical protein
MKNIKAQEPLRLSDADFYDVYRKWRDQTGVFECYVKATCFVSLRHYPDFALHHITARHDAIYRKISECVASEMEKAKIEKDTKADKTLFMLDLPAVKSLPASYLLNQDYKLKPVLTMRQLFHPQGIVGGEAEISALLQFGLCLHGGEPKGFVFVLDSDRHLEYDREVFLAKFNNQYELSVYDLPTLEMLRDTGFTKLLILHSGALKRDMADYVGRIRMQGFHACTLRVEG